MGSLVRYAASMLLFLLACHRGEKDSTSSPPLDLTEILAADEARAGVVTDTAALFGGISAEGQAGDLKIYNDRVQFVIQGVREGSYYASYGGGLIDADRVRDAGQPGRDLIDEAMPMAGFGRIASATKVEVVADGSDGEAAVVRATAKGAPFMLLVGALESEDAVPDRDVDLVTDYRLEPGSALLEVTTRVTWNDEDGSALSGDIIMVSLDVVDPWLPGRGFDGETPDTLAWVGGMSRDNELSLAIFPDGDSFATSALTDTLQELAPGLTAMAGSFPVTDGTSYSWTRFIGVGRDLATLTDTWYPTQGIATEPFTGTVMSGGAPLAGARVHLLDADGLPVTVAVSDETGAWTATAPVGQVTQAVASGRGHAEHADIAPGAGWYGPYAASEPEATTLASIADGATPIPMADGYGFSATTAITTGASATVELTPPGWISVDTGDGLPAAVRVSFSDGDPARGDEALVPERPGGLAALGWTPDGAVTLPVEPGDYEVLVHRGVRHELHQETVTVASGETVSITAPLAEAYALDGVWRIDPHSHASPSGDGEIPMEHRLLVQAAQGVDIHVGTDHDHVADYRVLLAPLGLDGVFTSVVADEVSPVLRGHFNAYPLEEVPSKPNNGAVLWWEEIVSTEALFGKIRDMAGGGGVIQVNHPAGNKGMFGYSGYSTSAGTVADGDRWAEDFDAVEVLNSGDYEEFLPFYLDLVRRGYEVTPTGVSDAHGHRASDGLSLTFIDLGISSLADFTPELLVNAMDRHATVVSRGPYLDATIDGTWAPGQTVTGAPTLEVTVLAPSWMPVETLTLYRDGEATDIRTLSGTAPEWGMERFVLEPESDASFVVIASSNAVMSGPWAGQTAWAMTAAIRVDLAGDGWEAPLPALTIK